MYVRVLSNALINNAKNLIIWLIMVASPDNTYFEFSLNFNFFSFKFYLPIIFTEGVKQAYKANNMSANLSGSSSLNLANGHSELNPGSCSSVYSPASPTSSLPGNQGDGNGLIDVEVNGEEEEGLDFVYSGHHAELLESMGNLRRQNHFCDAVLRVGEREVS